MWVGGRNREAQAGHSLSQSWLLQLRPHYVPGDFPTLPPILFGLPPPSPKEPGIRMQILASFGSEGGGEPGKECENPHHPTLCLWHW